MTHDARLRIAVFIDFDNIEIGVKNTLGSSFDAGLVLEALKERGEVVSKTAYSDWQRAGGYSRQLTQHAIRMVQRNMTPGGDKNGADINLALDALEMAFTHPHINAFVIVGGDSDFISLVEKLKQYDKKVFVVGGRQFTSVVMQRNCHEFIAYENLAGARRQTAGGRSPQPDRTPIDQVIPLVTRALKVISEREASPQLGLLKSTLVQLDSTFSERSYVSGSFRDFVDKLEKMGVVKLHHGGKGGMLVELAEGALRGRSAAAEAMNNDAEAKIAHASEPAVPAHPAHPADAVDRADSSDQAEPADPEPADVDDGELAMVRRAGGGRPAASGDAQGPGSRRGDGRQAGHGSGRPPQHQTSQAASPAGNGDGRPAGPIAVTGTPAEGIREFRAIMQAATITRWPMYLRNVKQLIRQVNPSFDERAYGFANLADLLRGAHKENVMRVERDRQGVLRVFQAVAVPAASVPAAQEPIVPEVIEAPSPVMQEAASSSGAEDLVPSEQPADEAPAETAKPRRRSPARKTARKAAPEPRRKKARA